MNQNLKNISTREKLQQSIRDAVYMREVIERSRKNFFEECPPEPDDYSLHQIGLLVKYFLFLKKCQILSFYRTIKLSYLRKKLKKLDESERK